MPTLADLGKLVKQKYPQYRNMSDEEVGRATKQKFPDKYKQYTDTALVQRDRFELDYNDFQNFLIQESGLMDISSNSSVYDKYAETFNFFNPNSGWISSYIQERRTKKHSEIAKNLSDIQMQLLGAITAQANAVQERRKTAAEFYFFIQENFGKLRALQSQIERAEDAWDKYEMTPTDVSTVRREEATSAIRINEYSKKSDIDLNKTLREKQEAVRLALVSKHLSEIQKISLIQDNIDEVYHQINEIEHGKIASGNGLPLVEWIKTEMVEDRKEIIAGLKETRRAIDRRLRETHTRANLSGVDENTELR